MFISLQGRTSHNIDDVSENCPQQQKEVFTEAVLSVSANLGQAESPERHCGHFLNDRCRRAKSSLGSTTPGQVALGCIRKQAEQAMAIEPVSSIPSWLLLSSCPDFLCELEVYHKPSPTPRLFCLGVYHSNREAKKASR